MLKAGRLVHNRPILYLFKNSTLYIIKIEIHIHKLLIKKKSHDEIYN